MTISADIPSPEHSGNPKSKIEEYTKSYAGGDYDRPREVCVGLIDILTEWASLDDLISELQEFKHKFCHCRIEPDFESSLGEESSRATFQAYRMETAEETEVRVSQTRERAMQSFEEGKRIARSYVERYGL